MCLVYCTSFAFLDGLVISVVASIQGVCLTVAWLPVASAYRLGLVECRSPLAQRASGHDIQFLQWWLFDNYVYKFYCTCAEKGNMYFFICDVGLVLNVNNNVMNSMRVCQTYITVFQPHLCGYYTLLYHHFNESPSALR